jgi:hypothetical protein
LFTQSGAPSGISGDAAFSRSIYEGVGPLLAVLLAQAAAGDPDLAEFAATVERKRSGARRSAV